MGAMSDFSIVTTKAGVVSIRDNVTQEIMHNPVGPWVEANSLYIEQSQLARRLAPQSEAPSELVIFDVGLGAAANALAALHCAKRVATKGPCRPLRIVSFERDLKLLEFALVHSAEFEHFEGYEPAIESILSDGFWQSEGIHWELRHGDFREQLEREVPSPELIYFDPYSPVKNPEMWGADTFRKLRAHCRHESTLLMTYSRATSVRAAMLVAGFFVGVGIASGSKDETTQASTHPLTLSKPLDQSWLKRWEISSKPYPPNLASDEMIAFRDSLMRHPQFRLPGR
jgi:tRNA U34 5-methylaminomethyl-2-thiouridine-forming methyltransferase MnmC